MVDFFCAGIVVRYDMDEEFRKICDGSGGGVRGLEFGVKLT
jgi:hypothetical protein